MWIGGRSWCFGAPLVPADLALYFMNSADRWFVQYFHGEEALGIFAVGAKLHF